MLLKDKLSSLKPDLAIVADYGLIIPKEIFSIPRHKTLNIHFSKLPLLRGPSPVQYTILMGEKTAWISLIIMAEEIDTGDIIWQKEIKSFNNKHLTINNETSKSLYEKLFNIAALEVPYVINKYIQGDLKPKKQDHSAATYTKHFTREDGYIPSAIINAAINRVPLTSEKLKEWKLTQFLSNQLSISNYQLTIEKVLRAFSPWPGVWTTIQITDNKQQTTKRLKILKTHIAQSTINHQPRRNGIHDAVITYPSQTASGQSTILVPDLVQLEGKKPVTWQQLKEGYPNISFYTSNK